MRDRRQLRRIPKLGLAYSARHGRTCSGHPRISYVSEGKTWMPAPRAGMTILFASRIKHSNTQGRQQRVADAAKLLAVADLERTAVRDSARVEFLDSASR
jgi:hypothetical protein